MYIGLNAARLSHALNGLFAVDQVSWVAHGCRCAEQGLGAHKVQQCLILCAKLLALAK
jgi:hypothetical protein